MTFLSNNGIHVKSQHSCQITTFMSNHNIHVKSQHSCQIMSNYAIHVKSCRLRQIVPFNCAKSWHSCQIIAFMSNHVVHVKSCHPCEILSLMPFVIGLFRTFSKAGDLIGEVKYVFLGLQQQLRCPAEGKNILVWGIIISFWVIEDAEKKGCYLAFFKGVEVKLLFLKSNLEVARLIQKSTVWGINITL
jgi:hypothetical protein